MTIIIELDLCAHQHGRLRRSRRRAPDSQCMYAGLATNRSVVPHAQQCHSLQHPVVGIAPRPHGQADAQHKVCALARGGQHPGPGGEGSQGGAVVQAGGCGAKRGRLARHQLALFQTTLCCCEMYSPGSCLCSETACTP